MSFKSSFESCGSEEPVIILESEPVIPSQTRGHSRLSNQSFEVMQPVIPDPMTSHSRLAGERETPYNSLSDSMLEETVGDLNRLDELDSLTRLLELDSRTTTLDNS